MDVVGTRHAYEFGFMTPDTYRILKSDECTAIIKQMFTDYVDNENDDDDNVDDDNVDNQMDDDKENDDDNVDNQKDDDNDRQQQQKDEKDMRKIVRMNDIRDVFTASRNIDDIFKTTTTFFLPFLFFVF